MKGQLRTIDDAIPTSNQHKKPCADCPWSRKSIQGWLGDLSPEGWIRDAHGETKIDCHVHLGPQCAGAAIYRANVCKVPRDKTLLSLPEDTKRVFRSPQEFLDHHRKGPGSW